MEDSKKKFRGERSSGIKRSYDQTEDADRKQVQVKVQKHDDSNFKMPDIPLRKLNAKKMLEKDKAEEEEEDDDDDAISLFADSTMFSGLFPTDFPDDSGELFPRNKSTINGQTDQKGEAVISISSDKLYFKKPTSFGNSLVSNFKNKLCTTTNSFYTPYLTIESSTDFRVRDEDPLSHKKEETLQSEMLTNPTNRRPNTQTQVRELNVLKSTDEHQSADQRLPARIPLKGNICDQERGSHKKEESLQSETLKKPLMRRPNTQIQVKELTALKCTDERQPASQRLPARIPLKRNVCDQDKSSDKKGEESLQPEKPPNTGQNSQIQVIKLNVLKSTDEDQPASQRLPARITLKGNVRDQERGSHKKEEESLQSELLKKPPIRRPNTQIQVRELTALKSTDEHQPADQGLPARIPLKRNMLKEEAGTTKGKKSVRFDSQINHNAQQCRKRPPVRSPLPESPERNLPLPRLSEVPSALEPSGGRPSALISQVIRSPTQISRNNMLYKTKEAASNQTSTVTERTRPVNEVASSLARIDVSKNHLKKPKAATSNQASTVAEQTTPVNEVASSSLATVDVSKNRLKKPKAATNNQAATVDEQETRPANELASLRAPIRVSRVDKKLPTQQGRYQYRYNFVPPPSNEDPVCDYLTNGHCQNSKCSSSHRINHCSIRNETKYISTLQRYKEEGHHFALQETLLSLVRELVDLGNAGTYLVWKKFFSVMCEVKGDAVHNNIARLLQWLQSLELQPFSVKNVFTLILEYNFFNVTRDYIESLIRRSNFRVTAEIMKAYICDCITTNRSSQQYVTFIYNVLIMNAEDGALLKLLRYNRHEIYMYLGLLESCDAEKALLIRRKIRHCTAVSSSSSSHSQSDDLNTFQNGFCKGQPSCQMAVSHDSHSNHLSKMNQKTEMEDQDYSSQTFQSDINGLDKFQTFPIGHAVEPIYSAENSHPSLLRRYESRTTNVERHPNTSRRTVMPSYGSDRKIPAVNNQPILPHQSVNQHRQNQFYVSKPVSRHENQLVPMANHVKPSTQNYHVDSNELDRIIKAIEYSFQVNDMQNVGEILTDKHFYHNFCIFSMIQDVVKKKILESTIDQLKSLYYTIGDITGGTPHKKVVEALINISNGVYGHLVHKGRVKEAAPVSAIITELEEYSKSHHVPDHNYQESYDERPGPSWR